ncbi:MAG: hypothetical protein HQL12_05500 [Candidatus Omnitrophica bacterium]|nr:hypothetical protein [Candidatus Omnitrophota bacterium]
MANFNPHKKAVLVLAGILVLSLSLSSCDSLRKKFTRQKKKGEAEDQAFVPVLEPEEYPAPIDNPQQNYKENYDLIKAWYKDLWTAIDDKSTARYLHYTIGQVTNHITRMEQLVDVPTRADLAKLAGFLDYYKASLDTPWNVRNVSRIQSDLRGFDRFLRDHLRADRIKGHFVKSVK